MLKRTQKDKALLFTKETEQLNEHNLKNDPKHVCMVMEVKTRIPHINYNY